MKREMYKDAVPRVSGKFAAQRWDLLGIAKVCIFERKKMESSSINSCC